MIRRLTAAIVLVAALLATAPARAETQAQLKNRILKALASHEPKNVQFVYDKAILVRLFATAAELTADTDEPDGTIGYALDTDVYYFMTGGSWVAISSLATMANGATITNAVNGTVVLTEGGEDLTIAVTSNLLTLASTTGATYAFTPAVAITGDLTLSGGAGALTLSDSASSVVVPSNDASALDMGSAALTTMIRFDTTTNAQNVVVGTGGGGFVAAAGTTITGAVTLDNSDCGRSFAITAAADTTSITLPALSATTDGCTFRFHYVGADGGALVDISPNAADGIEGSCTLAASVVELSGTDDADVGLTKATIKKGDTITIADVGDADDWYASAIQGICANN